MKKGRITWWGVVKGTLFIFIAQLGIVVLGTAYGGFIHFDKIESVAHGIQGVVAGIRNASPIVLKMTLIVFLLLAIWKTTSDIKDRWRD